MSATITDYFNKASNMSGSYPAVATVTAARSTGGSTLSCDDLSSWATDTPVHFSTFKVNTDGTIDTSTQTDWKGIVNGNTITDMTRLAGAADSGNASGDRVELNPTIGWLDDLITGILVSHKQNGALKDGVVTESSIATGAVSTTKIADSAVTSAKVAAGAISSYDKIGDDVIQARNIADLSYNTATLNTTYASGGAIRYIVFGNIVLVQFIDIKLKSIPDGDTATLASGLPNAASSTIFIICNRGYDNQYKSNLRLRVDGTNIKFHWSAMGSMSDQGYSGIVWYLAS